MRGRTPKPTRLKMLTGNPGKRALNGNEPRPEAAIPECPAELGPVARTEWDRLAGELAALRLLTNLDRAVAWATDMTALAPLTQAYSKRVLNAAVETDDGQLLEAFEGCWASQDFAEGRRARTERREPVFQGR